MTTINKIWNQDHKNLIYYWVQKMNNLAYKLDYYQPRSVSGFKKRARKTINGEFMENVIWAYGIEWKGQGEVPNEIYAAFNAYLRLGHPDNDNVLNDLDIIEQIDGKYSFQIVSIGWAGTPPADDNYRADIEIIEDELCLLKLIKLFFKLNNELQTSLRAA